MTNRHRRDGGSGSPGEGGGSPRRVVQGTHSQEDTHPADDQSASRVQVEENIKERVLAGHVSVTTVAVVNNRISETASGALEAHIYPKEN
uniref:DUF2382 domain-containing protein n=1 Tax=Steinernema glaseri TaxID=37863 RepID=A0A1I7ZD85_9BILA